MSKNMSRQEFMESMVVIATDDLRYTNSPEKVVESLVGYGLDKHVAEMMVHRLQVKKAEAEIQAGRNNISRGMIAVVIMVGGSMLLTLSTGGLGIFFLIPSIFLAPGWVAFGMFQVHGGKHMLKLLQENPPNKSKNRLNV